MTIKDQLADNIVGHWDFRTGSIKDLSTVGEDGTFDGTPVFNNTKSGRELRLDGTTQGVVIGGTEVYAPTDQPWTVFATVNFDGFDISTLNTIIALRSNGTSAWRVGISNIGGYLGLFMGTNVDTSFAVGKTNAAFPTGIHRIVVTFNGNNDGALANFEAYIDGEKQTLVAASALSSLTQMTKIGTLGIQYFDGGILEAGVMDIELTSEQSSQLYNESLQEAFLTHIPNKTLDTAGDTAINFYQTGQDWNVSNANVTAGLLENTGWTIGTGTWKVEDSSDGNKQLSCIATGRISFPSQQAYGTWEFDLYQAAAGNPVFYIISTTPSSLKWGALISATQEIELFNSTSGFVTSTAAATVSAQTWYRFKVTRDVANLWTTYLSTDNGITYTAVTADEGTSNPVTNANHPTSAYTVANFVTGDAVRNIKFTPL